MYVSCIGLSQSKFPIVHDNAVMSVTATKIHILENFTMLQYGTLRLLL
jgi:hypothetical protein